MVLDYKYSESIHNGQLVCTFEFPELNYWVDILKREQTREELSEIALAHVREKFPIETQT